MSSFRESTDVGMEGADAPPKRHSKGAYFLVSVMKREREMEMEMEQKLKRQVMNGTG
jgi:hypothetical protein